MRFRVCSKAHQQGAIIPEFIISLPVLLILFFFLVSLGSRIDNRSYLYQNAASAALVAAGSTQPDPQIRESAARDLARNLFRASTAKYVVGREDPQLQPFEATFNSTNQTVKIDFNADIFRFFPAEIVGVYSLPNQSSVGGSIVVPYLVSPGQRVGDDPISPVAYCPNGNAVPSDADPTDFCNPPPPDPCYNNPYCGGGGGGDPCSGSGGGSNGYAQEYRRTARSAARAGSSNRQAAAYQNDAVVAAPCYSLTVGTQ
ncbi:MAG: hypothetical protein DCC75_03125 [Proteobacteria bacterium]|nr:MAG: hypothetical protein DCC75_03125 [Pseudomonadota bacterium]